MKKKLLRSIICFLLAAMMITECNLSAVTAFASEITEEKSEEAENEKEISEEAEEEENEEIIEETEEEEFEENEEIIEEIPTASSYLYPFEEAVTALEELAKEREIPAVVYLAEDVVLRMLPEESSEPVKNLVTGDVVHIIGAGQDAEYNIWYQVSYVNEIEEVTGYVRKDNIACVDEEFVKWQEIYVRSISMFTRMRGGVTYSDVEMFPESYQEALYELKQKHPNWIFVKMNTKLDWKYVVKTQVGNNSWIWASTAEESWKNGMTGDPSWAYASEGIIKYYMDPRNWIGERDVFQFELLGYASQYHTVENVENILTGSFMANKIVENGKTYAQTFVELGKVTGVSPFLMAARVRQEQGTNGNSALISGTYKGYEGYYNYYNIGAYGNNVLETIVNGLKKAKDMGWNSRYKSLQAGAKFLGAEYVKAGQDTLYLQKFDVDDRMYGTCYHQYMQNIQAPYSEAKNVYRAYNNKGLLSQAFIFRIPVYNNMPSKASVCPGQEDKITLSSTQIDNLQVDSEITLHPYVNGKEANGLKWIFTSSDESVATVDSNGVVKALKSGETTITCKNAQDLENPNVGTCKIKVITVDIDLSKLKIPVLEEITYDPIRALKDIILPGGYTWVNPEMVPTVAKAAYGVTYNPDEEKYNPITFDLNLKVNKRKVTSADYSIPTGLEGGAGRELRAVVLPNGFTWNNPEEKLASTVGNKEYLASYNPDNANYESAVDIKIPVKIVCEKHEFGEWEVTNSSCEKDGVKVRKCIICSEKEELIIEKTNHHYVSEITENPTEEKEGLRTYICEDCGNTYTESIPKLPQTHKHSYEEYVTKKASCTEKGEKMFECSCGDIYTEMIEAKGHKVENGRCQQCGYTDVTETPKDDNKPNKGEENTGGNGSTGGNTTTGGNSSTGGSSTTGGNGNPGIDSKPSGSTSTEGSSKPSGSTSTEGSSKPNGSTSTEGSSKPSGSTTTGGNSSTGGSSTTGGNSNSGTESKPSVDVGTGGGSSKPSGSTSTEGSSKPSGSTSTEGSSKPSGSTTTGGNGSTGGNSNPGTESKPSVDVGTGGGSSKPSGSTSTEGSSQPSGSTTTGGNGSTGGNTTTGGNSSTGGSSTTGGNSNSGTDSKPSVDVGTGGGISKPSGSTSTEGSSQPSGSTSTEGDSKPSGSTSTEGSSQPSGSTTTGGNGSTGGNTTTGGNSSTGGSSTTEGNSNSGTDSKPSVDVGTGGENSKPSGSTSTEGDSKPSGSTSTEGSSKPSGSTSTEGSSKPSGSTSTEESSKPSGNTSTEESSKPSENISVGGDSASNGNTGTGSGVNSNTDNTNDSEQNASSDNGILNGTTENSDSDHKNTDSNINSNVTNENSDTETEQSDTPKQPVSTTTQTENVENHVEIELMSELVESVIEEGNSDGEKQTLSIQLNKNAEISQNLVKIAKENRVDLEVNLPNNLKWTINSESLTSDMAAVINMNAEIVQGVIAKEMIDVVAGENEYMELSLSHDGEFGFEAMLTIPVEAKYIGQTANLFYFNEKTKMLEFQMASPVDEKGNVQLVFNHASDYVIVFAENSLAALVMELKPLEGSTQTDAANEMFQTEEQKKEANQLLVVCVIIMILAGGLATAGYFIYFNKKEISDGQNFEEWIKEDFRKEKSENKTDNRKVTKKSEECRQEQAENEYLDDDVDDYKEKNISGEQSIISIKTEEIKEDDYFDEEDDYQEIDSKEFVLKNVSESEKSNQDIDYLDDDVDDYQEKV